MSIVDKPKTKKQVETEKFVDDYILRFGFPPTYKQVSEHFKTDISAAHFRCRNFRNKMRKNEPTKKNLRIDISNNRLLGEFIGTLEGICAWEIPEELRMKLQEKVDKLRKTEITLNEHN